MKSKIHKCVQKRQLGRLISMEPNEDIFRMNCLFEFYKKLNSIG